MFGFKKDFAEAQKDLAEASKYQNEGVPQVKSVGCFECHMMVVESRAQRFDVEDMDTFGFVGGQIELSKKGTGFLCPQHFIPKLSMIRINNGAVTYLKFMPATYVAIDKKGEEIKAKPAKK